MLLISLLLIGAGGAMAQASGIDSTQWNKIVQQSKQIALTSSQAFEQKTDSLILLASQAADTFKLAEAYKIKGDALWQSGRLPASLPWLQNAATLASKIEARDLLVRINNNLGGVYLKAGQYDKALSCYNMAYSLGRSTLTQYQKAVLNNNIGIVYRNLRQFNQADLYLNEALDIYKIIQDTVGQAQVYNNLGLVEVDQGQFYNAIDFYNKALALNKIKDRKKGIAYAYTNMGKAYILSGEYATALRFLKDSYKLNKELNNLESLGNVSTSLGQCFYGMNQLDSAQFYINQGLSNFKQTGNLQDQGRALRELANIYKLQNKQDLQVDVLDQLVQINDSLYRTELTEKIAMAEAETNLIRKDQQIEKLREETSNKSEQLANRNIILWLTLLLTLLLFLFILFYLRRFRTERKANAKLQTHYEQIQHQKDQIEQQHELIQLKNSELTKAKDLIEHYNEELQSVNEQLEDKIRERTRALTDTYRKLSFHINNTPLAVLEWNKNMELIRWPNQAQRIFGYKGSEVLGIAAPQQPFMHDDQHQRFLEAIEQHKWQNLPTSFQNNFKQTFINSDGETVFVEWIHSVLTNELGELESVLSIANDVSLQEEAYQEAKDINQELDTFIYKASHDLRGPIARMQGIINLGKLESVDEKAHFYYGLLEKVTNEFHTLLGRLLTIHDIQQETSYLENLNLKDQIKEVLPQVNQEVTISIPIPEGFKVASDKRLLQIILRNLIENSITFANPYKPQIVITGKKAANGSVYIKVQDNGAGIDKAIRERVFDMFYQGSSKSTGTGLGLYMVRKAARKLGGDVWISEEEGLTTFVVHLPKSDFVQQPQNSDESKISAA